MEQVLTIVLENLQIQAMMQTHKRAKFLPEVGWGQFCTLVKSKADMSKKMALEVEGFFRS